MVTSLKAKKVKYSILMLCFLNYEIAIKMDWKQFVVEKLRKRLNFLLLLSWMNFSHFYLSKFANRRDLVQKWHSAGLIRKLRIPGDREMFAFKFVTRNNSGWSVKAKSIRKNVFMPRLMLRPDSEMKCWHLLLLLFFPSCRIWFGFGFESEMRQNLFQNGGRKSAINWDNKKMWFFLVFWLKKSRSCKRAIKEVICLFDIVCDLYLQSLMFCF